MALNMFSNFLNMFSRKKAPAASQQIAQPLTNLQQAPTAPTPGTLTPAAPAPYTPKAPSTGPLPTFNYQSSPTPTASTAALMPAPALPGAPVADSPTASDTPGIGTMPVTGDPTYDVKLKQLYDGTMAAINHPKTSDVERQSIIMSYQLKSKEILDAFKTNQPYVQPKVKVGSSIPELVNVLSPIEKYQIPVTKDGVTTYQGYAGGSEGLSKTQAENWAKLQSIDFATAKKAMEDMFTRENKPAALDIAKIADMTGKSTADVQRVLKSIVDRGAAPKSDLGLPDTFELPSLTGTPSNTPAAGPIEGLPESVLSAPEFAPLTLPDINVNTGFTPELEAQITKILMDRIEEQKQKDISAAQGAAAMRGLTGGSFEGRMTGAATKGAQKASAEALTALAIEKATREREAALEKQKQQFEVYKMELNNKNQAMENYRQRSFQAGESDKDKVFTAKMTQLEQAYNSLEAYKQRAFAAGEADKGRYYESQQQALQREHEILLTQMRAEQEKQAQERAARESANRAWIDVASSLLGAAGTVAGAYAGKPPTTNTIP